MRFYDFQIFNADGSPYSFKGGGTTPPILAHWTSLDPNTGIPNPGALNVEFDIPIYNQSTTSADASFTLWGGGLSVISQSSDLAYDKTNLKKVLFSVGMSKGLPLANPNQHGSPFNFKIIQAYGNWIGVNQTLNLRLQSSSDPPPTSSTTTPSNTPVQAAPTPTPAPTAASGSQSTNAGLLSAVAVTPYTPLDPTTPVNIQFTWTQGQTLSAAIQNTLTAAFPGASINIAISPNLISYVTMIGYYQSLQQFAAAIYALSIRNMNSSAYPGVSVTARGNVINITDGMNATTTTAGIATPPPATASATSSGTGTQANPIQINFTDLIGPPVWQNISTIQFMCVMRGDIYPMKWIKLPAAAQSLVTSSQSSQSDLRNTTIFQGAFIVSSIRLIGNFRSPNPESWVTVIEAASLGTAVNS